MQDWSHIVAQERPKDDRDILLGAVQAPVSIPDTFLPDNSWLQRNFQGQTPFCGEHAGTHLKAILDYYANGTAKRYSPRYGVIKLKAPGSPLNDGFAISAGTDMRSIFKWLQKAGAADFEPLEDDVTLPTSKYCDASVVTPAIDANAAQSTIDSYAFGNTDFQSLRQDIFQNKAVLLLIRCDDAFWGTANPTFTTPQYGHYVVADGYTPTAIRVIDSADPNTATWVKMIGKQYVTPTFIKESGTGVDIPPEVKQQLTQSAPAPLPQVIQSTQQNVWILQQIVSLWQAILNLINPKVGSADPSMDNNQFPWWVSSTGQGVAQRILAFSALVIPILSLFGIKLQQQDVETFVNATCVVVFAFWQLWAWARANVLKQAHLGKYAPPISK